jgi:hypothetical protein
MVASNNIYQVTSLSYGSLLRLGNILNVRLGLRTYLYRQLAKQGQTGDAADAIVSFQWCVARSDVGNDVFQVFISNSGPDHVWYEPTVMSDTCFDEVKELGVCI